MLIDTPHLVSPIPFDPTQRGGDNLDTRGLKNTLALDAIGMAQE